MEMVMMRFIRVWVVDGIWFFFWLVFFLLVLVGLESLGISI